MVNRENWKLTRLYLEYRSGRVSERTVDRDRSGLKHLLEWADATSLYNVHQVSPLFPIYLATYGLTTYKTQARIGVIARGFFDWLKRAEPKKSSKLNELFIESLIPRKRHDMVGQLDPYTVDEIITLCSFADDSLSVQRTQGAVALMFLGGLRSGAVVTLPIECVDLDAGEIRQWPECGVDTKAGKRATTYLLDIHVLLDIVRRWDDMVRSRLSPTNAWYAAIQAGELVEAPITNNRGIGLARALRRLCTQADVRYRRPHQIRHGHATYALEHCQDMADYKAVSVNLMHESIATTDAVYVNIRSDKVKVRIEGLLDS